MASFCPKCGSAIPANEQFCTSCGAAATYGATPAPQVAAPVKSGNTALKIILIIVGVIALLGILVLGAIGYIGYRVSRSIHTGPDGQMSIQTPEGKVNLNSSQTFTAAELGTDPYPGAQATRGGMKMNLPGGSMVMGSYLTSDSKQQVIDFYKAKFGSNTMVMDTADGAIITFAKSKQESIMVTITANPSRDSGKTRISITHTINTKTP
jgi:hypothetical protein